MFVISFYALYHQTGYIYNPLEIVPTELKVFQEKNNFLRVHKFPKFLGLDFSCVIFLLFFSCIENLQDFLK